MKKEELNLVTLTVTEEGRVFARIYRQLKEDLNDEQLDRILGYIEKIADTIRELEEENENE